MPVDRHEAAAAPAAEPRIGVEVPVTTLGEKLGQNSPSLAVDPTEERFVVLASRVDAPDFRCALNVSGDGGRSWLSASPVPELPTGAERCYAPEVAFDRSGVLHYLFVGLQGGGNTPMGVFLTTSADRALSFTKPRLLLGPHNYMVRMVLDRDEGPGGRLHLAWLKPGTEPPTGGLPAGDNPILAAHSDDGGKTFSKPVRVDATGAERAVAPALALGPDGAVHVGYYDLQDDARDYQGLEGPPWEGTWSLRVATSTDGGATFDRHAVVDEEIVPPERVMLIMTMPPPALVADADGRVHIAWWDARRGDWDVFASRSTDGATTWSAPTRLNDDAVSNGRHQYLPRLSVSDDGRLDAIFYDRRDDSGNEANHVYHTFSTDGGQQFSPNRRITSESFYSGTGARYSIPSAKGLVEFGSRLALAPTRNATLAAWTDTRLSRRGGSQQDIFATKLVYAPAGGSGLGLARGLALVGVAAVVGAVGVGAVARRRRPGPGDDTPAPPPAGGDDVDADADPVVVAQEPVAG